MLIAICHLALTCPRRALPLLAFCIPLAASAQDHVPSKVDIPFNRYYDFDELNTHVRAVAAAYPDLVELRTIGHSLEGREMILAIVNDPASGPHTAKPAMWIDGNVHGNEIQAAEVVLYTLWYLTRMRAHNERIANLLHDYSFYLLVSQNPDGRAAWFRDAHNSSSSRSNRRPVDDDNDGLFDEDGPDDLDGDGSITQMWRPDPNGRFIRDRHDPRIFTRVEDDQHGDWTPAGSEGIDNDGDGRINEDGPGGDDMNRNWPSDWKPDYVQYGAGPYPLNHPETAAVAQFILSRPNIASVQSYHNAAGMLLRGPGASYRESAYPPEDRRVYDEIGRIGEDIIPYYRYLVIYRDLYTVHGGFVNWTAEGLGAYSFTNEMWTEAKAFQRDIASPSPEQDWLFRDRLQFGQTFKDYTEFDHPIYGKVLIGGGNKWDSRNTPTFLLEEECHRNFAFTMFHADQMPVLSWGRIEAAREGPLWVLNVEVKNDKLMPSRSGVRRRNGIGAADLLTVEPAGAVVAAGRPNNWIDRQVDPVRFEPARIRLDAGIPGRGVATYRFYLTANPGDTISLRYTSDWAKSIETTVTLTEPAVDPGR